MGKMIDNIVHLILLLSLLTVALSCPLHRRIAVGTRTKFDTNEYESRTPLEKRNLRLPKGFQCPPDIGEIDCYHELMGLWMRLLMQQ